MKRILLISILICMVLSIMGCKNSAQKDTAVLDDHGYCLTLNKQIVVVKNQITTQLTNIKLVTDETRDSILSSANASISIIIEAINKVDAMAAPLEYEANKQEALRAMCSAEANIKLFADALANSDGDTDYSSIATRLQSDDAALAAIFNVYYK